MFRPIHKIRNAITYVIFLYTLITSLRGFTALARDLIKEVKYKWRRRTSDITRFESSLH